MADNVTINKTTVAGGENIATSDVGGAQYQVVILGDGTDVLEIVSGGDSVTTLVPIAGQDDAGLARPLVVSEDGKLDVTMDDLYNVFQQLLVEQKKTNLYLAAQTDMVIDDLDIG